jgi:circadian clock protein KaiC
MGGGAEARGGDSRRHSHTPGEHGAEENGRCPTGVTGLDEVLHGGLVPRRAYLARGGPGTGKTTLGLHFLRTGLAVGQRTLLLTLEFNEKQLRTDAAAQGLDLEGVQVLDLSPSREFFAQNRSYDIFSPADVERDPTTRRIVQTVEELRPERVFVDAITTLRYLTPDPFQFRKQALSFLTLPRGARGDGADELGADGKRAGRRSPVHERRHRGAGRRR